jgi:hypothetical protein
MSSLLVIIEFIDWRYSQSCWYSNSLQYFEPGTNSNIRLLQKLVRYPFHTRNSLVYMATIVRISTGIQYPWRQSINWILAPVHSAGSWRQSTNRGPCGSPLIWTLAAVRQSGSWRQSIHWILAEVHSLDLGGSSPVWILADVNRSGTWRQSIHWILAAFP